jgi:hypothetical protein
LNLIHHSFDLYIRRTRILDACATIIGGTENASHFMFRDIPETGVSQSIDTFNRSDQHNVRSCHPPFITLTQRRPKPPLDSPHTSMMECIMTTTPTTQSHTPPFDAQRVAVLRQALDIAVEQIAVQHRTPATKAMMAQIIIRHAADGITDTSALVNHAVQAGAAGAP